MAQTAARAYTMPDNVMLERAEVFSSCLNAELADFTVKFPWMDSAWASAFEAETKAADAFPSDLSLLLDIGVLSSDLRAAMERGYAALQALAGYATLAWPTDLSRQRAFGQDRWPEARPNTLLLAEMLELAHATAQSADFKPQLLDKGYRQEAIDQLDALVTELYERNKLLEAAKADRKVKRHDRVALFNMVWERMSTLSICASVVWAKDAERRAQYQRYRAKTKVMDGKNAPVAG
ncbi:MAG: hypothetical protein K9J06_00070 [Flavobacteriales bacterium]|nr:hypothetical protein [Flavobacteriales bacterium]